MATLTAAENWNETGEAGFHGPTALAKHWHFIP